MAKDYVRRGNTSKKKSKTKRKQSSPSRKVIVLTLLLLSGFGYLLYVLNAQPEPAQTTKKVETQTTKPRKQVPAVKLPPKPKEEWSYMKELESKEIEITAKEQQTSQYVYIMPCGAFRSATHADELKAKIAFQGLQSSVKKTSSGMHQVLLGPYDSKRQAERDRHKLQRIKVECKIWPRKKSQ